VSRLVEVPSAQRFPQVLTIVAGDVVRFDASGGHVREGGAVEVLGVFVGALLGTDGTVLTPAGGPNVVLFRGRAPGRARIDVVTGDPWRAPVTRALTVVVEA